MRHFLILLVVPFVAATAACSGRVILGDSPEANNGALEQGDSGIRVGDENDGGLDQSDAPHTIPVQSDDGGGGGSETPLPASCAASGATVHTFTSLADFTARLQGRWLGCAGFIYQPADAVGIEIAGEFAYFLIQGPGNTLVRGTGDDYLRTVVTETTAYDYQLNLGSGPFDAGSPTEFDYYNVDAFDGPIRLRLNEATSLNVAVYEPAPSP